MNKFVFFGLFLVFYETESKRFLIYFNNDTLDEYDSCSYSENLIGYCRKLEDCKEEYEKYKNSSDVLKICKYGTSLKEDLICCPLQDELLKNQQPEDFTNFEFCMNNSIEKRKGLRNPSDLYDAFVEDRKIITTEDCDNFEKYKHNIKKTSDLYQEKEEGIYTIYNLSKDYGICRNEQYFPPEAFGFGIGGNLVAKGDRTNMAAVGWTQENKEILFNCGGSILSPRWIITAAHCKFFGGKVADVVRVGDRFLKTPQDDEHAQQFKVSQFIIHPDYKSNLKYNDIALVKTDQNIIFMEYVNHACIPEISRNLHLSPGLSVAGFGETENGTNGNILIELSATAYGYDKNGTSFESPECSKVFEGFENLPKSIQQSQICVKSPRDPLGNIPDTCYGDSGSPLQFNELLDVKDNNYDTTLMKTTYKIPLIVGLVSFGIAGPCGSDNPSVYTHVPFYKEWIKSVITSE